MDDIKNYKWDFIKNNEDDTRSFYYCTSKDNQVYIVSTPTNIDLNTKVAYYVPGTGGAYPDSIDNNASIDYYLNSMDSNSNTILIGYKEAQPYANELSINTKYANYNSEILNEVINECNLNSNQVNTFMGWSNGAGISLQMGINYLKDEKEKNGMMNSHLFCLINSAGYAPDVINEEDIKLLAESKSSLFVVTENLHQNAYNEYLNWSKKYGINIIRLNCYGDFSSSHSSGNYNFAKNGGLDFLMGNEKYDISFFDDVLEKYDPKTDTWLKLSSSEAQEYLGISSTDFNSFDDYINGISLTLNHYSFHKINIESTTNVPNICINAVNELINCSNILIDKINEELNSLLKVKNSIEQMDRMLYEKSQYLNMNINSHEFEMIKTNESIVSEFNTIKETIPAHNENNNIKSETNEIIQEDIIQIDDNDSLNSKQSTENHRINNNSSKVYNEELLVNDGNYNIKLIFEKKQGNIIGIKEGYSINDFKNVYELETYIYNKYTRKVEYNIVNNTAYVSMEIDDYNRLYGVK